MSHLRGGSAHLRIFPGLKNHTVYASSFIVQNHYIALRCRSTVMSKLVFDFDVGSIFYLYYNKPGGSVSAMGYSPHLEHPGQSHAGLGNTSSRLSWFPWCQRDRDARRASPKEETIRNPPAQVGKLRPEMSLRQLGLAAEPFIEWAGEPAR